MLAAVDWLVGIWLLLIAALAACQVRWRLGALLPFTGLTLRLYAVLAERCRNHHPLDVEQLVTDTVL